MTDIDTIEDFYNSYLRNDKLINLLNTYNLRIAGSVPAVIWELFAAIITDQKGFQGSAGADLHGWEVKSASNTGSYEYQYHLNTGKEKLEDDCKVNHIYINYSNLYQDIEVRVMRGQDLAQKYFNAWVTPYCYNYNKGLQRFRRSIPYGYIKNNGLLVLKIHNGNIAYSDLAIIQQLNSEFNEKFY